jgi:hypothetical protein
MPENEESVEALSNSVAAEAPVVSGTPSRIIEYFPPGPTVTGRDCMWGGSAFTKGATVKGPDGIYECSGDEDGRWTKIK